MDRIYLDNAATTRLSRRALGAIEANRARGSHVITSAVEHPSVLNTLYSLEKLGSIRLTVLPVDGYGRVSVVDVFAAMRSDTVLLSVMLANNEVGTLQPISSIGNLCRERGVLFHVDAVQGAGHLPLDVQALRADMLTLSAHKFHGPRGVGAAYARKGTQVAPLMTGGEQEKHRRAGTENVAGTVGMAEALMEQTEDMEQERERLQSLSEKLIGGILSTVPDCQLTGHRMKRLPGVVSFLFEGVSPDELLALLDMQGVAASAGSACTAGSNEPSHVLQAMGLLDGRRCAPLRLSLGRYTKAEEIDRVLDILSKTVARLRG